MIVEFIVKVSIKNFFAQKDTSAARANFATNQAPILTFRSLNRTFYLFNGTRTFMCE